MVDRTPSAPLLTGSARGLLFGSVLACACAPQAPVGDPGGATSAAAFDAHTPGGIALPLSAGISSGTLSAASTGKLPDPLPEAGAPPSASSPVPAASGPSAAASAAPSGPDPSWDLKNAARPSATSGDLTAKAARLFSAVQQDDASLAADFFFPRDAFLPVKDIANPGKYWDQLFRTYHRDIHDLHVKHRAKIDGAQFLDIQPGSPAKWVPPGEEANKIGYYRSFNAKVRYQKGDAFGHFDVRVSITWQGKWFITHLLPWK